MAQNIATEIILAIVFGAFMGVMFMCWLFGIFDIDSKDICIDCSYKRFYIDYITWKHNYSSEHCNENKID